MELGVRIIERLELLQMSQAELARRAGIAQTTVNSLIKRNRRSSPHLVRLARELQTTPAYLTGETDDPASEQPEDTFRPSSEEREWLELLRALDPENRKAALQLVRTIASRASAATIHEAGQDYRAPKAEGPVKLWDRKIGQKDSAGDKRGAIKRTRAEK